MSETSQSDTGDKFANYYEQESLKESTLARFRSTRDAILRVRRSLGAARSSPGLAHCGAVPEVGRPIDDHGLTGAHPREQLARVSTRAAEGD